MSVHTFPDGGLPPAESAIDSHDQLAEFFEKLEPLGSSSLLDIPSIWSDFDHRDHSDPLNLDNTYPPMKSLRLNESNNFQHEKVLGTGSVPGETATSNFILGIESHDLFSDRSINGRLAPWLSDNAKGRLTVAPTENIDGPLNMESVQKVQHSSHEHIKEDHPSESVDILKDDILKEDIYINPLAARRVPPALISSYVKILKEEIEFSYVGICRVERDRLAQCKNLPMGTSRYKPLSSPPKEPVIFKLIQDHNKKVVKKDKVVLSLQILVRWFFYSHSQLLEHLNVDKKERSLAQDEAFSWLFSEIFLSKAGAPIFNKVFDNDVSHSLNFGKVQSLIIGFIPDPDAEKKASCLSIFLLELYYKENWPTAWNEILHENESFLILMRRILMKQDHITKMKKN